MMKNLLIKLLTPNEELDHVFLITPKFLKERNIRGLILDLDNTLVPHGPKVVPTLLLRHKLKDWLGELAQNDIKIYIVSNGLPKRVQNWAQKLGIPGISSAAKPFQRNFLRACEQMGLNPSEIAVVGDQLFTDILGGNRLGSYTILVNPLIKTGFLHTRLTRVLERIAVWQIKKAKRNPGK